MKFTTAPSAARLCDSPARVDARHNLCGRKRPATRPQGAGILGCLCLAAGARIPRSRLAATLWDRVPDFQGRASFRQAFRELIVSLGPLADELISSDRETVKLNTNLCWIDALAVLAPGQTGVKRAFAATSPRCVAANCLKGWTISASRSTSG